MKKIIRCIVLLLSLCAFSGLTVCAESYTYNADGEAVISPDAYTADSYVSAGDLELESLVKPTDIKVSPTGRVAVSDTGNARIVLTDVLFTDSIVLDKFMVDGNEDCFKTPTGLCFTEDEHLYVCDRENGRIIEFDENLEYIRSIKDIEKDMLPKGFSFYPDSVAVDKWGSIYCVSYSSTNGYLQFSKEGEFKGFFGSPQATLTLAEKAWYKMQTKEQRKRSTQSLPVNFNCLTVDAEGFVYTTEVNANKESVSMAIKNGTKSGIFMPIKKFNFKGVDVLERRDFYAPAGDIDFETAYQENELETGELWASELNCITLGEDGVYFAADAKRNKIFGYDSSGRLLYVFGGTGSRKGSFSHLTAIAYHNGHLYALDTNSGIITRFSLTQYGEMLHEAIALSKDLKYEEAAECWKEILKSNQNLTSAYVGIGQSYLNQENYKEAMEYFRLAGDREGYDDAFAKWRNEWIGEHFFLVILGAVVLCCIPVMLLSRVGRFNQYPSKRRHSFLGHLCYGWYVIFHPFDGFWDIKHEKRGGVGAAAVVMTLSAALVGLQTKLMDFSFQQNVSVNILLIVGVVLIAALVFCLANWCLTSLADGKAKFRDIFIVTGYSMSPLLLFSVPVTLLSNVLTSSEPAFASALITVSYVWMLFLLFIGILTTQEYTLGQNILFMILTLVGMAVIVFVAFLALNLVGRIGGFVDGIFTEWNLRR